MCVYYTRLVIREEAIYVACTRRPPTIKGEQFIRENNYASQSASQSVSEHCFVVAGAAVFVVHFIYTDTCVGALTIA